MTWTQNDTYQLIAGRPDAFETFVHIYWEEAVRFCWLIIRNVEDAQEAAQDAFVNVHRHHAQLREPANLKAWFYRILLNTARMRARKARREKPTFPLTDEVDPFEYASLDVRIDICRALMQLDANDRITIALRYYLDMTDKEASMAAGWTLGTYKWRLGRARRHLAAIIEIDRMPTEGGTHA